MTAQPVEANVVLTSDNSQYDRAMTTSAGNTDTLGMSVDNLGRKINNLAKTAGKTLIGISAGDVATITAATAAWSSYEKQMSRLQAQSAILTRTNTQQTAVMKDYTAAVKGLRTEYGTTTSEASKLVETLSKVTNMRQTRDLQDLSKVFVDMSHATGESSDGLASSLTNLQRVMGTPINSKNTRQYADQFTYLAAQTNTSAQGLIDFTANLAPAGRQIGITSNQMAGFATAFAKAGQDSGPAAQVFTKVTTDIAHSMATGSPEIAHYANLLGVTQKAFKNMTGGEQVLAIFEKLQAQGKGAATELNRLGLDGPRSIRSIQAVLQQGGLQDAMNLATGTGSKGAAAEGAAASTRGMSDEISRLNQNFQQLAETMGGYFGPTLEKFLQGMNKALEVVNKIAEGPMGKFVALVMGVVAPLAAGAGMLLIFAGALMKVAAAFTLFRSSAMYGVREGFQGGGPMGSGSVGLRGEQLGRPGGGTWFQRAQYTGGQAAGSLLSSALGTARTGWQAGRSWADPNYTPGPSRGALSYLAGGLGRGIDTFLTPQFDQMRYADPTKRERSRFFPRSEMGVSQNVRDTAAEADAARARARTAGAVYQSAQAAYGAGDPQADQARREMHRANQEAIAATRASVTANKEQTESVKNLNRETGNTTTGFRRLTQAGAGYAAGAGGGVLGAGRAAAGMFLRSPMAMPFAGMAGLAAGSAMGINSQAFNLGMMGTMFGSPVTAAAGAGIGAILDARQQTQGFNQIVAARQQALREGAPSGILAANQAAISEFRPYQAQEQMSRWDRLTHPGQLVGNIGRGLGSAYQFATGGGDAYGTRQSQAQAAQEQSKSLVGALTQVSRRQGKPLGDIDTSTAEGMQKLDGVINDLTPTMDKLKISTSDIIDAYNSTDTKEGQKAWATMARNLASPDQGLGYIDAARSTAAGRAMDASPSARRSIHFQEDVGAFYKGTSEIFDRLRKQGMSNLDIIRSTERTQAKIGDENSRTYELQMAVSAKAQQNLQMQMPLMGRAQQFQATIGQLNALSGITPRTAEQATQLDQQKTATAQAFVDQASYFKQMLLMQDQYEIQRTRAQQDYSLQRSYQEHDFQLQRSRAEYSFHLSQTRATADYYRSVRRAHFDFNLQRSRAEDDYQHSIQVQAKQMAQNVYDIYQRVQVQRTSSASQILSNAADQLSRMRQQERDLDKLRGMGATDSMIQQMKFTDPQNQQQLARFLTEATPRVIRQFNQVAGSLREGAAKQLMNDPSSLDAEERRRQHRLQLQRTREDFERQLRLGHDDFTRAMGRQRKDFNLMMDQQATDFSTQMGRQADAYQLSMQRSAEDLANVGKEIDGNFESILVRATKNLTGHAQTQAEAVLKSFRGLKSSTSTEAIATMQNLAEIFGFKYTIPKGVSNNAPSTRGTNDMSMHATGGHSLPGMHQGGVVPGWTPGRDTQRINVSGGEAIMRPEWARAVGPAVIDALNHQAKHGGFAGGGVVWPLPHSTWSTYPGHDGIDLNAPNDLGKPFYAAVPGKISYTGWGHGYGDAIFESGPYGTLVYGHGSKVAVQAGQQVAAGQYIGNVGSTGHSTGPHLHVGFPGGTSQEILAFLHGAAHTGYGASAMATSEAIRAAFKDRYPASEAAAKSMTGVHPLFPGDISKVMNRMGHDAVRRIRRQMGDPQQGAINLGNEPASNLSNEGIVHVGANRAGWGNQWADLRQIVMHESGFRNTAQNPTSSAYGMFQFLDSTWGNYGGKKTSDPWLQTQYGLEYIKDRYKDPNGAWNFWKAHNWYGKGSVFTGPQTIGVGENGPEAVIPLNDRGGEFLTKAMLGAEVRGVGMGSTPMRGGLSVYNTRIDKSTNFTGPITVQANDPNELLNKLQARQRVMALSRPSLTGSAA